MEEKKNEGKTERMKEKTVLKERLAYGKKASSDSMARRAYKKSACDFYSSSVASFSESGTNMTPTPIWSILYLL